MTKPRRTVGYLILVLLILLVVAIIGVLSAVLFNMKTPLDIREPPYIPPATALVTNIGSRTTPIAELRIDIPPDEMQTIAQPPRPVAGIIPTVCDGLGAQIHGRTAFGGPTTHSAEVTSSRVTFTIDVGESQPAEGTTNIR